MSGGFGVLLLPQPQGLNRILYERGAVRERAAEIDENSTVRMFQAADPHCARRVRELILMCQAVRRFPPWGERAHVPVLNSPRDHWIDLKALLDGFVGGGHIARFEPYAQRIKTRRCGDDGL